MKRLLAVFIVILLHLPSLACTTFFINQDGQLVVGRNYDWITDAGMLCSNLRGLSKTSMPTTDGTTISWVSQYGSVTFNQYGKEFPTGGMNEKGLVVELMWLDETRYPAPDQRPAVGVLQWIQYQLDNCSTIDEVIATDKKLRIASVGTSPLHYLIADAGGHAATIEFLNGKMVTHKNTELDLPVLTNSVYDESSRLYKNAAAAGKSSSFAYGNNSLERFGQACSMVQQIKNGQTDKQVIDYAFDILSSVAQGSATKWSIVYDISNKTIRFRTQRFPQIKSMAMTGLDFSCTARPQVFDINQETGGDIHKRLLDFTVDMNRLLVEKAARESASQVEIKEKTQIALWQYPSAISCR